MEALAGLSPQRFLVAVEVGALAVQGPQVAHRAASQGNLGSMQLLQLPRDRLRLVQVLSDKSRRRPLACSWVVLSLAVLAVGVKSPLLLRLEALVDHPFGAVAVVVRVDATRQPLLSWAAGLGEALEHTPLAEVAQLEQTVPLPRQVRRALLQIPFAVDSVEGVADAQLRPQPLALLAVPVVLVEGEAVVAALA